MIPINDLQGKIYQTLNSDLDIKIYDEVPSQASMPLLTIGNYILSAMECKEEGYIINWNIDIYTDYEGKKQVNDLTVKAIDSMYKLVDSYLEGSYMINDVILESATVSRIEGYYVSNIIVKIEIN